MEARFKPGDPVRIREHYPRTHMRTPRYIQGKRGMIEAVHGVFRDPESLAYGGDGSPRQYLYLVRFAATQVWPTATAAAHDKLLIDIYEHWLEPA